MHVPVYAVLTLGQHFVDPILLESLAQSDHFLLEDEKFNFDGLLLHLLHKLFLEKLLRRHFYDKDYLFGYQLEI